MYTVCQHISRNVVVVVIYEVKIYTELDFLETNRIKRIWLTVNA